MFSALQALNGLPQNLIVAVLAATGFDFTKLFFMVPWSLVHLVCEVVPLDVQRSLLGEDYDRLSLKQQLRSSVDG
jgi:hypothetical protein